MLSLKKFAPFNSKQTISFRVKNILSIKKIAIRSIAHYVQIGRNGNCRQNNSSIVVESGVDWQAVAIHKRWVYNCKNRYMEISRTA